MTPYDRPAASLTCAAQRKIETLQMSGGKNPETNGTLLLTIARDSATLLPSKPNNTVGLTHMIEGCASAPRDL